MAIPTASADQRISGPVELLQAVPYLLGFHPHDSLVLLALDDGRLVVTARLDIADAVVPGLLGNTVAAVRKGGTTSLVAVVYDDSPGMPAALCVGVDREQHPALPSHGARAEHIKLLVRMVAAVAEVAQDHDCVLLDVLCVSHARWRSLLCASSHCCPIDGVPLSVAPSAFTTAATVAGIHALPSREMLERSLDPAPVADRARLLPGLASAEREAEAAARDAQVRKQRHRSLTRALFAAARAADEPAWAPADPAEVARFAVALCELPIRDAVWMAIDQGWLDGRAMWRDIGRRAPSPYDAPPLFLFGWASWRAGDGARAGIAAERAIASDPGYTAGDLLLAAVADGVDPRRVPRLRPRRAR